MFLNGCYKRLTLGFEFCRGLKSSTSQGNLGHANQLNPCALHVTSCTSAIHTHWIPGSIACKCGLLILAPTTTSTQGQILKYSHCFRVKYFVYTAFEQTLRFLNFSACIFSLECLTLIVPLPQFTALTRENIYSFLQATETVRSSR